MKGSIRGSARPIGVLRKGQRSSGEGICPDIIVYQSLQSVQCLQNKGGKADESEIFGQDVAIAAWFRYESDSSATPDKGHVSKGYASPKHFN